MSMNSSERPPQHSQESDPGDHQSSSTPLVSFDVIRSLTGNASNVSVTSEQKSDYLQQYIANCLSRDKLNSESLQRLREENSLLHRRDIINALSAFINTQLENLEHLSQIPRYKALINERRQLAETARIYALYNDWGDTFKMTCDTKDQALELLVSLAQMNHTHDQADHSPGQVV